MNKPELLLPAGNTESFYAALEGGADAVYLGLKHFNARERAFNFSNQQIPVLLDLAHKKKAKVYITLNTVVKNNELPECVGFS
jgi:putative protease